MTMPATLLARVAHCFGDDYDVDQIVGVENIKVQDPERLKALALERLGAEFRAHVGPATVLVGGRNFGYGHPHFPAMRAMRALGVCAVIAESFFPVYWRGEISNGFPQVACAGIAAAARAGERVEIDFDACIVRPEQGRALAFEPYAPHEWRILAAGGFRAWLAQSLAAERGASSGVEQRA